MKSNYFIALLAFTFTILQGCKEPEDKSDSILDLKTKLSVIQYKQDSFMINEKIKKRDNLYAQNEVYLLLDKFDLFMESYSKETDSLINFIDAVTSNLLNQENLDNNALFAKIDNRTLLSLYNHEKATSYMLSTDNKYNGKAIQLRINHFISTFTLESNDVFVSSLFFEPIRFENIYTEDGGLFSWEYTFDHLPLIECLRYLQTIKEKIIDLNIQAYSLENCLEKSDLMNHEIKSHNLIKTSE